MGIVVRQNVLTYDPMSCNFEVFNLNQKTGKGNVLAFEYPFDFSNEKHPCFEYRNNEDNEKTVTIDGEMVDRRLVLMSKFNYGM